MIKKNFYLLIYIFKKVFAFGFILLIFSFFYLHSSAGQQSIKSFCESHLTSYLGCPVAIKQIDFSAYGMLQAQGISIHLPSGEQVAMQKILLEGSPLTLLSTGSFNLSLEGIQIAKLPALHLKCTALLFEKNLEIEAALLEALSPVLKLTASLPLYRKGGFWPAFDFSASLQAAARADLALASYANVLLPESLFIAGQVDFSLNMAGTLVAPQIRGSGKLYAGYLESFSLGTCLSDIKSDFVITNSALEVVSLSAQDSQAGLVQGQGELKFESPWPFIFSLQLDKAALLQTDILAGTFSGSLSIQGNHQKTELKGELFSDVFNIFCRKIMQAI